MEKVFILSHSIYLGVTVFVVPSVAKVCGRVVLPVFSSEVLAPHNLVTPLSPKINGFGTTTCAAEESVDLESGFEVTAGGEFEADIETCVEE